jgi:hypothetical protein
MIRPVLIAGLALAAPAAFAQSMACNVDIAVSGSVAGHIVDVSTDDGATLYVPVK